MINARSEIDRGSVLRAFVFFALLFSVAIAEAKDKPRVGLNMELMSIRNRSSGPLPVRVRVEYNLPQILEGDLELLIYDGRDGYTKDDLMATIHHDGIVLAGRDYEFNLLLPPLRTAVTQNWAVEAWFITEQERIPLSSIQDRPDPPEAHDLLTTSPLERGMLLCSCSPDPTASTASANRRFLEEALSLDNFNPLYAELEAENGPSSDATSGASQVEKIGRTVIHFAGQWSTRDLPADPLSYCAFDAVLLSDGALSKLTTEQLTGLSKWVRAGGSVCILPDAPMKAQHLEFLRTLFKQATDDATDLTLDDDGRLLVIADENDPVILSHFGLGRAVLLPVVDNLKDRLQGEELGRVVAFLWKVRKDQGVATGEPWRSESLLNILARMNIAAKQDKNGVYLVNPNDRLAEFFGSRRINGKVYVGREQLKSMYGVDARLNPNTEPLLSYAEQILLPSDVEMVPVWIVGVILTGYVLTIGPIDYFVLGWLKKRKYTWIVFPLVTLAFTFITIAVANRYMGSEDTGGKLVINDVTDDGITARQTVLETLFMGAQTEISLDHTSQFVIQAEDSFTAADWQNMYGEEQQRKPDLPLSYSGHFPQKFSTVQQVEQWSPVSLRTLSLEPGDVKLPKFDWSDLSLINTAEGNQRLRQMISKEAVAAKLICSAVIYHEGEARVLLGPPEQSVNLNQRVLPQYGMAQITSRDAAIQSVLSFIPTMKTSDQSFFRVVSQISPEGAGSLEDLAFVDPSDPDQWGLAIMMTDGNDIHVFRKLYVER